jgi:neurotransmitter:Na+ symporter, NSS family
MQGIRWNSKAAFIFATSAAAIGLGNIWRFTYVVGENGGGLFVLLYILCVIGLGIPLMLAEIVMGRLHRSHPVEVTRQLAEANGKSRLWGMLGGIMLLSGFLILGYYVVIAGWVLHYFFSAVGHGYEHVTVASVKENFACLTHNSTQLIAITAGLIIAAGVILSLGVKQGLERAVLFMFPFMFLLILILLVYAVIDTDFMSGVRYLFKPDFSKISSASSFYSVFLSALGQAFFSLNIGMGVACMFSAYLPKEISVVKAALWVTVADTGFAILSGLIIFPFVIKFGLKFSAGPGLIFETLPLAFSQMSLGYWVGSIFFLMVFFAAFSSVIALLEPTLCWLMQTFSMKRSTAVLALTSVIALMSMGTIGSFCWPQYFTLHGYSFFTALDSLTAKILLPLCGLLVAIFVGFVVSSNMIESEFGWSKRAFIYSSWRFILRWVAPIIIVLIFISALI